MIKYFKTFFYPAPVTYSYDRSTELVINTLHEVFKNKITFLGTNDMIGNFLNEDSFVINIVSPAFPIRMKYSSSLIGKITSTKKGTTQILTRSKPSLVFYILFFFTIIVGLINLFQFIENGTKAFLGSSLLFLIIGPALSIGLSNVAIAATAERYKIFIDRRVRTT